MNLIFNKKNITILTVTLIISIILITFVAGMQIHKTERQNKIAAESYYDVLQTIRQDKKSIKSAKNKMEDILSNNPNIKISNIIAISIAQLHFELEEYEDSIKIYKSLILNLKSKDSIMPIVLSGLKMNYEKLKLLDKLKETNDQLEKMGIF